MSGRDRSREYDRQTHVKLAEIFFLFNKFCSLSA